MTDQQFDQLNERLGQLVILLRSCVAANTSCIERMKRIDTRAVLDQAEHRRDRKLQIDRIAEQRAREAARDKAERNALKDAFIRSGLWVEMAKTITAVNKVWPKDYAKG